MGEFQAYRFNTDFLDWSDAFTEILMKTTVLWNTMQCSLLTFTDTAEKFAATVPLFN
jgi:hypothetical protein